MHEYFNRYGYRITQDEQKALLEDYTYTRVLETNLGGGISILTEWTGDTTKRGPGGPEVFKTVVKGDDVGVQEFTYATEEQAARHHDALVAIYEDEHMGPQGDRFADVANEID